MYAYKKHKREYINRFLKVVPESQDYVFCLNIPVTILFYTWKNS